MKEIENAVLYVLNVLHTVHLSNELSTMCVRTVHKHRKRAYICTVLPVRTIRTLQKPTPHLLFIEMFNYNRKFTQLTVLYVHVTQTTETHCTVHVVCVQTVLYE